LTARPQDCKTKKLHDTKNQQPTTNNQQLNTRGFIK